MGLFRRLHWCIPQRSVEINDKDLPAKRSRADDTSVCEAEALEEDSSAVFVSDPGLIGFLKCKDHSSHIKLSDFVERSIVRFLEEYLQAQILRSAAYSVFI
jgi:hypothetical protein